jgi:hypothetical protein
MTGDVYLLIRLTAPPEGILCKIYSSRNIKNRFFLINVEMDVKDSRGQGFKESSNKSQSFFLQSLVPGLFYAVFFFHLNPQILESSNPIYHLILICHLDFI